MPPYGKLKKDDGQIAYLRRPSFQYQERAERRVQEAGGVRFRPLQ